MACLYVSSDKSKKEGQTLRHYDDEEQLPRRIEERKLTTFNAQVRIAAGSFDRDASNTNDRVVALLSDVGIVGIVSNQKITVVTAIDKYHFALLGPAFQSIGLEGEEEEAQEEEEEEERRRRIGDDETSLCRDPDVGADSFPFWKTSRRTTQVPLPVQFTYNKKMSTTTTRMACFLLLVSLAYCLPDQFPDPEPDPRNMNVRKYMYESSQVPSDVDVGFEYWKSKQPQPRVGEPVHLLDDDHVLGQVRKSEKHVEIHEQAVTVPPSSDADVGFGYWTNGQPQPHPGEPVYLSDEDHILGRVQERKQDLRDRKQHIADDGLGYWSTADGHVSKSDKYSRGRALHPHLPRPTNTDTYFGEVAGEESFYGGGSRVCEYLTPAYMPIHQGSPKIEAIFNAHNVGIYRSEAEARTKHRFSCATLEPVWIRRYCNAPKVACTKDGSFQGRFQDRYAPENWGHGGPAALPLDFCNDLPAFMKTVDRGRDRDARPTYCMRRRSEGTKGTAVVALECRGWHKNFAHDCVGRDASQTSGWYNFTERSYDHLPW
ncbi:hypothetical protein L249_8843 [Ophiocordyceps polyrhachis-furcata BCC 54312]|uniref:Uncharacterized protein n=1 Tax=Ophiocordyceps polyrhachis-furcata BCC 54312 TaxID=1330021 RepID=A0A367L263_9HYPO|nr:hypothetical protein L249_8843 [Ophiocordyceps polyrhachis-furcata BCC 54312]